MIRTCNGHKTFCTFAHLPFALLGFCMPCCAFCRCRCVSTFAADSGDSIHRSTYWYTFVVHNAMTEKEQERNSEGGREKNIPGRSTTKGKIACALHKHIAKKWRHLLAKYTKNIIFRWRHQRCWLISTTLCAQKYPPNYVAHKISTNFERTERIHKDEFCARELFLDAQ